VPAPRFTEADKNNDKRYAPMREFPERKQKKFKKEIKFEILTLTKRHERQFNERAKHPVIFHKVGTQLSKKKY